MRINDIEYVLKRYKYFMKNGKGETAAFYVGDRKEELPVTAEYRVLFDVIGQMIEHETGVNKKLLTDSLVRGKTNVYILSHLPLSRSSYYKKKLYLKFKIYCLCACKGILKYEDILRGNDNDR